MSAFVDNCKRRERTLLVMTSGASALNDDGDEVHDDEMMMISCLSSNAFATILDTFVFDSLVVEVFAFFSLIRNFYHYCNDCCCLIAVRVRQFGACPTTCCLCEWEMCAPL